MKIMLLVSSMHAGGAERVAATLVNAWAERGDAVILVPTYSDKGSCFYTVSGAVDTVWLADRTRGPAWRRLSALRTLIRERAPDIVVSFLTNVNVAAILATRGLNVPLIVCERTHPASNTTTGWGWRLLRRCVYPWADLVTVQSQATVAPFRKLVPRMQRLAVIPNPLPPELMQARVHAAPAGRKRLVAMGRLVTDKRFDWLIDAFAGLAADFPQWDLWIWGEGPQRASLQSRIAATGLDGRIRLPGRTDAPWREMSAAQAFAMCSAVEGFPNVLFEAMALGLPCLAVDCPSGPREISDDGRDALLVAATDRQGLDRHLRRLLGDDALRAALGVRAAQGVRGRYALEKVLNQWDALFAQVMMPPQAAAGPRA
jgi:GalNAc-alpha-(1->4)-GalNAc-alpha-(1->3)-diNAcBac-PP-undecaprenol alpha-1,4-N-acetyl-D-galactosaminyltransferase